MKKRTPEKIKEALTNAKIDENTVLPTSQTIYFSPSFTENNYKLLELDTHLIETLQQGDLLRIIGDDDENAVLCTKKHTYDLIDTETSNSLLLVNDLKFHSDIKDVENTSISEVVVNQISYKYLEAKRSRPRFRKLIQLLHKTAYKGPELDYQTEQNDLLTYDDMKNKVQASEEQLQEALKTLNVLTIDGKSRILEFEYSFRVLSYMLKLIDENSWATDEIDYNETINSLADIIPEEIVKQMFELYTEKSKIVDGVQLYKYKNDMVCKFFAEVLLKSAGKFKLAEFLQAWKESVPEGMTVDESILCGIAVIDRKANPNTIRAFFEEDLPEDIAARFKVLFEAKEKWAVPEISPYIQYVFTFLLTIF